MYSPAFALIDFGLLLLEPKQGSLYKAGKATQKSWSLRRAPAAITEDGGGARFWEIMCQVLLNLTNTLQM